MPDILLHETAVSWVRNAMRRTKPVCLPWEETPEQWSRRMLQCVDEVNRSCDVEGLCRRFHDRIDECLAEGGNRLSY